jgi:transcriptional regulator with XRE-family HTH domain
MRPSEAAEPFRDLLLRYRARSGMTQRQLAEGVGVYRRSVQEWENGSTYPSAERLETLLRVLLEAHGFAAGYEEAEASALCSAVQREAPHVHAPFDRAWFAHLLGDNQHAVAAAGQPHVNAPRRPEPAQRRDWGEAPDVSGFVGRDQEVQTLGGWIATERCRLVFVLGMGGIGKTTLVAKVAEHVAPGFERVYWRSLRDAPPVVEWLRGAIDFLSDQQLAPPASESQGLTLLLEQLRRERCLLVLDNSETLFEAGLDGGRYRVGMAGYARLFQAVGEAGHQSCVIVTSRERPSDLAMLAESAIRSLHLGGLGVRETQLLLASKQLAGSSEEWAELTARVGGNGLALKIVSETVCDLFGGEIGGFLAEAEETNVFGGIRRLLGEQLERCSPAELEVLRMLAVTREPVSIPTLLAALPRLGRGEGLEALEALRATLAG